MSDDVKKPPHPTSENGKDQEPDAQLQRAVGKSRQIGRRLAFLLRVAGPTAARVTLDLLTDGDFGGEIGDPAGDHEDPEMP